MHYNWQQKDWPEFYYDQEATQQIPLSFAESMGRVSGILATLSEESQVQSVIDMMVCEAIKTSAIEGEFLDRADVLSSIRNNLRLNARPEQVRDVKAAGIARLMVSVRETYAEPLDEDTLFSWHTMLMEGRRGINAGQWRTHSEPMQIISGAIGREEVHFEAPPSARVQEEMDRFFHWFNDTGPGGSQLIHNPLIRSAIAHLYFESIHPFEDGNGRIGRAISEKALSQGMGKPVLLSLSQAIETNRTAYYEMLKRGQRSNEITHWINYFIHIVAEAQEKAELQIEFTLKKTQLFDRLSGQLNVRQEKVLRRMLEEGPEGFEGGMNARKYMAITRSSKPTATRDMQELVALGVFEPEGEGRGRRYGLRI